MVSQIYSSLFVKPGKKGGPSHRHTHQAPLTPPEPKTASFPDWPLFSALCSTLGLSCSSGSNESGNLDQLLWSQDELHMLKTGAQLFWWLPWYRCSLSVSGPIAHPPLLPQCTHLMLQKTTWEIACISHISSAFHHSRIFEYMLFSFILKNNKQARVVLWDLGCVLLPLFWGLPRRWDHNSRSRSTAPFKPFSWLKPFLPLYSNLNVGPVHLEASGLKRHYHKPSQHQGISSEPPWQLEDPGLPVATQHASDPFLPSSLGTKQQLKAKEKYSFAACLLLALKDKMDSVVGSGAEKCPRDWPRAFLWSHNSLRPQKPLLSVLELSRDRMNKLCSHPSEPLPSEKNKIHQL